MIPWWILVVLGALLVLLGWILIKAAMSAAWPDEVIVRCIRNGSVKVYFGRGRFKNEVYETRGIPSIRDAPVPISVKKDMIGGGLFRKGHDTVYGESPAPGTIVWTEWNPTKDPIITPADRQWIHNEIAKADRRAPKKGILNNPQLLAMLTVLFMMVSLFVYGQFILKPQNDGLMTRAAAQDERDIRVANGIATQSDVCKIQAETMRSLLVRANITIFTNLTANDTIPI